MDRVTKEHARFDETPSEAGTWHLIEAASCIVPSVAKALMLAHSAAGQLLWRQWRRHQRACWCQVPVAGALHS